MAAPEVYIKARYTADGLGNRWNNSTTEIVLTPSDNPVTGRWNTTRRSDVDSTGGSPNAVYDWYKLTGVLCLRTEKPGSQNLVNTPITLIGLKDFKVGIKGTGIFNFRATNFPITWEIVKIR